LVPYADRKLKVFSGNANLPLAKAMAEHIGVSLGDMNVGLFSNGEIRVDVNESVRGADCFVISSGVKPVNQNLMELLIIGDALRRASARRITAVLPHYPYARQDRKARGREPITAKLVANLITTAGFARLLTIDLHANQIQGFFDKPVDHLHAGPLLAEYFKQKGYGGRDTVVVSPDASGVARARDLATKLNCGIAIIDKRRPEPNVSEVMNIIGDVNGKAAIMIDDMIDTAGTIVHGAEAIKKAGATHVFAACTHPVFSGPAYERLAASPFEEIVVTDTIPTTSDLLGDRLKVVSVAPLLARAIIRIHEDLSVSKIFDEEPRL
jgi:ribose-phosphate pyrophosphokinase